MSLFGLLDLLDNPGVVFVEEFSLDDRSLRVGVEVSSVVSAFACDLVIRPSVEGDAGFFDGAVGMI